MGRRERQRAQHHSPSAAIEPGEKELGAPAVRGPDREQQANSRVAEPAAGEPESICSRRIQPLKVVHSHEEARLGGKCSQDREHTSEDRATVRHAIRVSAQKRRLDGVSSHEGKIGELLESAQDELSRQGYHAEESDWYDDEPEDDDQR